MGNYDLIIAGEATIDGYTSQVGPRVAAELGIPVISFVRELKVEAIRSLPSVTLRMPCRQLRLNYLCW